MGHSNRHGYGPFNKLASMKVGDRFTIVRNGQLKTFEIKQVGYHRHLSKKLKLSWQATSGPSQTVLVTCSLGHLVNGQYTGWDAAIGVPVTTA